MGACWPCCCAGLGSRGPATSVVRPRASDGVSKLAVECMIVKVLDIAAVLRLCVKSSVQVQGVDGKRHRTRCHACKNVLSMHQADHLQLAMWLHLLSPRARWQLDAAHSTPGSLRQLTWCVQMSGFASTLQKYHHSTGTAWLGEPSRKPASLAEGQATMGCAMASQ